MTSIEEVEKPLPVHTSEEAVDGNKKAPSALSTRQRLIIVGFCTATFLVTGTLTTGLQGEFETLLKKGLFSNKCETAPAVPANNPPSSSPPTFPGSVESFTSDESSESSMGSTTATPASTPYQCQGPKKALTQTVDALASILNMLALPSGIAIDAMGHETGAIVGSIIWVIGMSISGLVPSIGYLWVAGSTLVTTAGNILLLSIMVGYLPVITAGNPQALHAVMGVFASLWDLSGLLGIVLGIYLTIDGLSLFVLFALYGIFLGIPLIVFFTYLKKSGGKPNVSSKETQEGKEAVTVPNESEEEVAPAAPPLTRRTKVLMLLTVLRRPFYLITLMESIMVVTLPYFVMANVAAMLLVKDQTADTSEARQGIVYAIAGCGLFGPIPGQIVGKLGTLKGVTAVTVIRMCLLIAYLALTTANYSDSTVGGNLQYAAMFCLGLWRITGFAVLDSVLVETYQYNFVMVLGTAFGMIYTLAGVVSISVGGWATYVVVHDHEKFTELNAVMAACAVTSSIFFVLVWNIQNPPASEKALSEAMTATTANNSSTNGGQTGEQKPLLN